MNRGAFLQPLARVRETRIVGTDAWKRVAFSPSRASARREVYAFMINSFWLSAPRARPRDAKARNGQRVIRGAFFSTSCASVRRTSAERAKRESRRFSSAPRARPRDAPARSGQSVNRGAFLQPLARVRETRQRGVGNARFAAAFFNLSRASARRASAERATRDSRRLSSTSRAHPRDAPTDYNL